MLVLKRLFKITLWFLLIALITAVGLIWLYTNSLISVKPEAQKYYSELKQALQLNGYSTEVYVVSGKRWDWDNELIVKYLGTLPQSQHTDGNAVDILVLDVNGDGESDAKDVDIVYQILDEQIVQNKGCVGTFKSKDNFIHRQLIHFDCRGSKVRWHN